MPALAAAGGHGFGADFSASMSAMFDDLFGEFMGQRRPRQRSARERGSDLRYNMEITLSRSLSGQDGANPRADHPSSAKAARARGAKAGTTPTTCRTCGGVGKVRASQGFFTIERTCPSCQGRGETIETPCPSCNGAGRVTRERTLSVTIPIGVEDGTRIRLAGEGEAGLRGGPPGDLYIFLSIKPHEFFQRDGADLFCRVPIAMTTAALGGQIEVPTIDGGRTRVKIPEGTESGKQFRLKAQGHAGAALQAAGRPLHPGRGRDTEEPVAQAARAAEVLRGRLQSEHEPGIDRLLRPGQGILRGHRRVASTLKLRL